MALDSSIGILGRVQIEGADSAADIVLGLDTNLTSIARDTGLFAAHGVASKANNLPIAFSDDTFMPFDWGNFAFVYDTKRLSSPPASFDELINSSADLMKIPFNLIPTSTPGMGLLTLDEVNIIEGRHEMGCPPAKNPLSPKAGGTAIHCF